jgi:UDP-GlcNAc:undecaprenyl-phosphate GlcNAc-1-phosphate transferase
MLNLGFPFGRRFMVFMGGAGSMFIGFTAIWLLFDASQGENVLVIRPVTALWFIALPLMDMVCIMTRRIMKGQSPFKPDREHLHHICQRMGLSSSTALLVICLLASLMAGVGIFQNCIMYLNRLCFFIFGCFCYLFSCYCEYLANNCFLHKTFKFTKP